MTAPSKGFVVYHSRNPRRMYADGTGGWWHELDKAKVWPTAREAALEVSRNKKIASGYEAYETAAARK